MTVVGSTATIGIGSTSNAYGRKYIQTAEPTTDVCDGDIWYDLSGSGGSSGSFDSGTLMLFQQTSAPTGWTKQSTHNNKSLRVVSGTAGSGGATAFTSIFGSSKSTNAHTLTTAQIPSHTHTASVSDPGHSHRGHRGTFSSGTAWGPSGLFGSQAFFTMTSVTTGISVSNSNRGSGGSHSHTMSMNLAYVDIIIASKD